jgi:hypothetical protein
VRVEPTDFGVSERTGTAPSAGLVPAKGVDTERRRARVRKKEQAMNQPKSKSRLRALCRTTFVGVTFGFVAIACGSSHTPTGSGSDAAKCQSSMQCLNGQVCASGKCVATTNGTNSVPPAPTTAPTTTAPVGPTPAPAPTTTTAPPPENTPVCAASLDTCAKNGDCCGFSTHSNYCVNTGGSLGAICAIACTSGSECSSGCCAPLKDGGSVCAPSTACQTACAADLGSCSKNGDCCGYATGHNYCVNTGGSLGAICAISCTSNSQCSSGCCASLTTGGAVCAPSSACGA